MTAPGADQVVEAARQVDMAKNLLRLYQGAASLNPPSIRVDRLEGARRACLAAARALAPTCEKHPPRT